MNLLPFFLIPAALLLLGVAGLRSYSLHLHNQRRRRRRKRPLKTDLLTRCLYIAAAVCLAAGIFTAGSEKPETHPTEPPAETGDTAPAETERVSKKTDVLLVNPWNPVPEDYVPDLVELDDYYGSAGMQVDRSCYDALLRMIDDCNTAGSRAYVLSSYRSFEYQQKLFDRKVNTLMADGLSRTDAETQAATVVVRPGTSEHHLGLAVDIIDTALWALEEAQENLPAQKWLMENSWRYGFILRYPRDKAAVTGVIYEPWHYRYVGEELAAELYECGLTLEEYLESQS